MPAISVAGCAADASHTLSRSARGEDGIPAQRQETTNRASERALRDFLEPGQPRLHFKSESDSRRRQILSRMCALDVRVSGWLVKQRSDREARPLSLAALTEDTVRGGVAKLVIERDASLERPDRRLIAGTIRPAAQCRAEDRTWHLCGERKTPGAFRGFSSVAGAGLEPATSRL